MVEMKCCGVNDYNDFSKSDSWNLHRGNKTIPEACCHQLIRDGESRPRDDNCTTSPSDTNSFYKKVRFRSNCERSWVTKTFLYIQVRFTELKTEIFVD